MKTLQKFIILITCLLPFTASALKTVTPASASELGGSDTYYIITEGLTLNADLTVGKGSVLSFQGGYIDLNGRLITFTANSIEAADYQIFRNAEGNSFKGSLADAMINAAWFGQLTGNSDPAVAVNKALAAFDSPMPVTLGAGSYALRSSIQMDREGASLSCAGELCLTSDMPAVVMSNLYQNLDVNIIRNKGRGYAGRGVQFAGNVYNSQIKVNRMEGLQRGFDFTARQAKKGVLHSGFQYNKLSWMDMNCNYGIYIDIASNVDGVNLKESWCNENQFDGGRIRGRYGIFVPKGKQAKGIDYLNGNVYRNIAFEGLTGTPIVYEHFMNERFYNMAVVDGGNETAKLSDGKYSVIDFTTPLAFGQITPQQAVHCVEVQGRFTSASSPFSFDRMYIMTDRNQSPVKYLSSSVQPRNVASVMNVNSSKTIGFEQLFAPVNSGVTGIGNMYVLSDMCELNVAASATLTVNYADAATVMPTGMLLKVTLQPNAAVRLVKGSVEQARISQSGIYRIGFLDSGKLSCVRL